MTLSPAMTTRFQALREQYRSALLDDVIPFWMQHSLDPEHGGYFTCLDRDGSVYDTDKFVWLQARQVWMFSMLYNRLEQRPEWLETARLGADFLLRHGMNRAGDWYFSLTQEGQPLIQPYNIFSDCFGAMAFSQYALASGSADARRIALRTYQHILRRQGNPKGKYTKAVPGTRPLIGLSLPMILSNLAFEMEWTLEPGVFDTTLDACLEQVFGRFLDRERMLLHESVAPDGTVVDSYEGRLLNPGHGIEAMWFLLDVAERRADRPTVELATDIILSTLRAGWDSQHGGIFYFLDLQGHPPQQLEWDQKLWWVHVETLVALLKAYRLSGREECWEWYERVHAYTWAHFPDPEQGEWYGYLTRQGQPLLPLKGGKWKGCFHVPRGLMKCAAILDSVL